MSEFQTTSVRGVIRNGDRILVEWFAPKSISFLPGGTVEAGESLEIALKRELSEELSGLGFEIRGYLGKIGHIWKTPSGFDSCLNHYFAVEILKDNGVEAKEKGREFKWIPLTETSSQNLQPPSLGELIVAFPQGGWDCIDRQL